MARRVRRKKISLALQGGGAHGAFTWGVLDRILEDGRLDIRAITATSAGAMNALALANGLHDDGLDGARASLEHFWREISRLGTPLASVAPAAVPSAFDAFNPFASLTPFNFAAAMTSFASPYDFNPFDYNPLREVLASAIDFEAVHESPIDLFIAATNVETGRVRIFKETDVTIEAALASACLPQTFRAVEIDGVPYWDGGYMGNPALFPLIYSGSPSDVLLVLLNPLIRRGTPRTAGAIQDRLNEISFNSALISELRAIAFVQKLLDQNWLAARITSDYRRLNIHAIRGGQMLCDLSLETKYDTRWSFLNELKDLGRDHADRWLETCFSKVGKKSSVNVQDEFLAL